MTHIRIALATLIAAATLGLTGGIALGSEGDDNNCAGTFVSGTAQALVQGFGAAVSGAAHVQQVDNFGLANCGVTPRQNP